MDIRSTPITGLLEVFPKTHPDNRGWFVELYKEEILGKMGIPIKFVQDNLSFSQKGVIRGLHLQLPPFQQAKLVTVITGKVLDVVVDLRKNSPTFGQVFTCILDSNLRNMLIVPEGFAHGFAALEDSHFLYKCSSGYSPAHETGIQWNDPKLSIDWKIQNPILSLKDRDLPTLEELLIKSVISPN